MIDFSSRAIRLKIDQWHSSTHVTWPRSLTRLVSRGHVIKSLSKCTAHMTDHVTCALRGVSEGHVTHSLLCDWLSCSAVFVQHSKPGSRDISLAFWLVVVQCSFRAAHFFLGWVSTMPGRGSGFNFLIKLFNLFNRNFNRIIQVLKKKKR